MDLSADNDALGLLTDLYELTMLQAYWHEGMNDTATFSLFYRQMPVQRNVILACGQEYAARRVSQLHFPPGRLAGSRRWTCFRMTFCSG